MAKKGEKLSEETKRKIGLSNSIALKGNKCHLGKKLTPEAKLKISLALKGHKPNSSSFKKGNIPWHIGKKGKDHPGWKGGVTEINQLERSRFKDTIHNEVLKRDHYTCQMCGHKGGELQVDHIQSWAEYVELRFSMDNCRTLCMDCHYFITFGKKKPEGILWGHNLGRRIVT